MDGSSRPRAPQPPSPDRGFSFTDWQTSNPTAPPPGDKLDAEFDRTNQAVQGVIDWVSVSLNPDGSLVEPPAGTPPPDSGGTALAFDYAEVSAAWAEHMPDTIPPNILAVMGITGDHWSARWWANRAAQIVQNAGGGGGFVDAPLDGRSYGRKSGGWDTVLNVNDGGTVYGPLTLSSAFTVNAVPTFNGTGPDGAIHVKSATDWPGAVFDINNTASGAFLRSNRNTKGRWVVYLGDDAPEAGGNQGTNFKISRFDDAGNQIDFPFQIDRASGQVLINGQSPFGGVPQQIDSRSFNFVSDFCTVNGPVSYVGNVVTLPGYTFSAADTGKTIILPIGGGSVGADAPTIRKIVGSPSGHTCTVDLAAVTDFTNATFCVGQALASTLTTTGIGPSAVDDQLVMQAGTVNPAARPTVYRVSQISVVNDGITTPATIVNAGGGGPPLATVYLRATTGHGRRPLFMGKTDATGKLDTGVPLTVVDAGALYMNMVNPANEPMAVDQPHITLPGSWAAGEDVVGSGQGLLTLNAAVPNTMITNTALRGLNTGVLRVGSGMTGPADNGQPGLINGTVISNISTVDPHLIHFSPPATNAGTNQDVLFASNTVKTLFGATFVTNSTTLHATAALPSWVVGDPVTGTLISGIGIAGSGTPAELNPTRIASIDGARTTITITNPTTTATVQPLNLLLNPVLAGVVLNIRCVPLMLKALDRGAYRSLLVSSAFAALKTVDGLTGLPITPTDTGVTVTPTAPNIQVGLGTDNATAIANWGAAVRAAATQAINQARVGTGVEAIWRPGRYLTTGSLNLVGMQDQLGPFISARGVALHVAHLPPDTGHPKGHVGVDMRASRCYVLDGLQMIGDLYFPPTVGFAFGRFDIRQAADAHLRMPTASGSFRFAGITAQSNENNELDHPNVVNEFVPLTSKTPVFGIVIDGWQHWQSHIPCDFGPTGTDADYASMPPDTAIVSFNGLRVSGASSMSTGGGIPWSIGGTNDLTIAQGYAESVNGPAILFYRGNTYADIDIHCEVHTGPGNLAGLQDQIMLCAVGVDSVTHVPNNFGAQFNCTYREMAGQCSNALLTYDTEGNFGNPVQSFSARNVDISIEGFGGVATAQVFDRFPDPVAWVNANFMGRINLGSTNYTALSHFMNRPGVLSGHLVLGNNEEDIDLVGYMQADSGLIRGDFNVNGDHTVVGNVYAETGLLIGPPEARTGQWTTSRLQIGAFGSTAHPATASAVLAFAATGNTVLGPPQTALYDHQLRVDFPGTLDVSGNGTNNAFVRINGTLAVFAPMSLPNGSTATTQAPGDNTTKVATTAFAGAAASAAAGAIVLPAPSTTTPVMDGTGAIGVGTTYARADHVHPSDTGRFPAAGGTINGSAVPLTMINSGQIDAYVRNTATSGGSWLHLDGPAATARRQIMFETAGSLRWTLGTNNLTESGSNFGSGFHLRGFNDDGVTATTYITILRQTGVMTLGVSTAGNTLNGPVGFNGNAPVAKPAITGSRSANAALANLLTQLAAIGLITDTSTA